jgi:riboflavin synthase
MFTGIIEEVGTVRSIRQTGTDYVLEIEAQKVLEDVQLGDSIAVNGVCLTVTAFSNTHFAVDVMPETLKATSLSRLGRGKRVNLERAMAANGRFGGHIVAGHVDEVGKVVERQALDNAVYFRIQGSKAVNRYVVPKGSITIDGISLTVVDTKEDTFSVSIIPHTLSQTILQEKHVGDEVNLEFDMLAKYLERLLQARDGDQGTGSGLTLETLAKHGYV